MISSISKLVPILQSIFGSLYDTKFPNFYCEFSSIYVQTWMTHQVVIIVVIIDVAIQYLHMAWEDVGQVTFP